MNPKNTILSSNQINNLDEKLSSIQNTLDSIRATIAIPKKRNYFSKEYVSNLYKNCKKEHPELSQKQIYAMVGEMLDNK